MNKLSINRTNLSAVFWATVFSSTGDQKSPEWKKLESTLPDLDLNRIQASYNTGSISQATAFCLFSLSKYFKPKTIAEVGTFIGKSTLSIASGMNQGEESRIYTCDSSNDIELTFTSCVPIVQFRRKSSVEMFNQIQAESNKIDMFFFDGRLTNDDLDLIAKISTSESIYAFDDFEGIEKGTINSIILFKTLLSKSHLLIYPPETQTLVALGQRTRSLLGVAIPMKSLRFVAQ